MFGEIRNLPAEIEEDLNKDFTESRNLILQFSFESNALMHCRDEEGER